jgi:hypothetical protein
MHKSDTKCNETIGKWCKNKHGASKIIDTLETYHNSSRVSEATDVGIPFGYPWISIPGLAHYGGGQVQGLDKMTWR